MTARRQRRSFGAVRRLPSGRYQASYIGGDGERRPAPRTFATSSDAEAWLDAHQAASDELTVIAETLSNLSDRLRALAAT